MDGAKYVQSSPPGNILGQNLGYPAYTTQINTAVDNTHYSNCSIGLSLSVCIIFGSFHDLDFTR